MMSLEGVELDESNKAPNIILKLVYTNGAYIWYFSQLHCIASDKDTELCDTLFIKDHPTDLQINF